jgi:hypothetical protein
MVATVSGTVAIGETSYDLRAPNVRFANIKSGDVLEGVASVRMAVTDDAAEQPIVSLLVDNVLKLLTNRKPYLYSLDTTKYPDGDHELRTFAYDSTGNKSDPAVIKVAFRNNLEKPVAAAMAVESRSEPVAPSEDDGVGKLLSPLTGPSVEPGIRTTGAARASEPEAHANKPAAVGRPHASKTVVKPPALARPQPARPAATTKPAAEPKAAAIAPAAKPAAAPSIAKPVPSEPSAARVAAAVPQHKPTVGQAEPRATAMAAEPAVALSLASPEPSDIGPAATATPATTAWPSQPALKQATPIVEPQQVASAAEPKAVTVKPTRVNIAPPTAGQPEPIVAGTVPATRAANAGSVASAFIGGTPPRVLKSPVSSSPKGVAAPSSVLRLRSSRVVLSAACPKPQAPRAPVDKARAAAPKPVRAAMLPSLRGGDQSLSAPSGIICPPPARQDIKAKLEKRLLPAKGKIKLRDLVNELGGVVFWDGATHTATAYLQNFKLEVQIGSSIVKVNGKKMRTDFVPRIVHDRTIIDAQLYAQACAFVERGPASSSVRAR